MNRQFLALVIPMTLVLVGCAHQATEGPGPAVIHHSVFERVVLTPLKPESNGIRLLGIHDGVVRVRLSDGYIIAAPARKGANFHYASHGYSGFTGIPLRDVNLRTGRVVLEFETRIYTSSG